MRTTIWAAVVAVGVFGLAACGSDSNDSSSAGSASSNSSASSGSASESPSAAGDAVLATADSPLGQIVVDGQGRTVYVFDKDTAGSGASACSGGCLQAWPAVTTESADPAVDGVDGDVGTITRDDGTKQVTLDGLPLYLYAADAQAGDVTGQGVGGIWWVVAPDGTKISGTASSAPSSTAPAAKTPAPAMPGY
jgi:predicted lipoprotein with Yx(FWY)xxD motif